MNLSDGGHIENLGVYELLRRGCRLIIAVDATADAAYAFSDLKNLVIRARNELGLAIDFLQDPETFIRPNPCRGFPRSHYVVPRLTDLEGKEPEDKLYERPGLLLFLKGLYAGSPAGSQRLGRKTRAKVTSIKPIIRPFPMNLRQISFSIRINGMPITN